MYSLWNNKLNGAPMDEASVEEMRAELAWYREREAQLLLYATGKSDQLDILTLDPKERGLKLEDGTVQVVYAELGEKIPRRGPWSSGDKERLADDDWFSPVDDVIDVACGEPTIADALSYVAIVECERAIRQAFRNARDGRSDPNGALWDTCFLSLFRQVIKVYGEARSASRDDDGLGASEERKSLAKVLQENVLLTENLTSTQDRCGRLLLAARAMRQRILELGGEDPGSP